MPVFYPRKQDVERAAKMAQAALQDERNRAQEAAKPYIDGPKSIVLELQPDGTYAPKK